MLGTLEDREQHVIRMRYGLDDGQPRTLDQIGRRFGLSRERVRQIERETMAKLRIGSGRTACVPTPADALYPHRRRPLQGTAPFRVGPDAAKAALSALSAPKAAFGTSAPGPAEPVGDDTAIRQAKSGQGGLTSTA